ncbi:hypothetical protein EJ02DRAFT_427263 [Clathrospora elynae]|uniref:Uncharacterized protein n=1 Tax=Clathrospora elynae TaxID=706981 RepID=A0A6A5SE13_9PLEO|nr:hypothetical protein EJ02DRAFT_427263 [Clathrospora elynae]
MRDARNSQLSARVKPDTPGPYKYRSPKPSKDTTLPRKATTLVDVSKSRRAHNSHRVEESNNDMALALADIPDFVLRLKVAQLMAVAPGLPVRDLYHLIINSKHDFPLGSIPQPLHPFAFAPEVANLTQGLDEIVTKIDYNDPLFEWDVDTPYPEPAPQPKARSQNRNRKQSRPPNMSSPKVFTTQGNLRNAQSRLRRAGPLSMPEERKGHQQTSHIYSDSDLEMLSYEEMDLEIDMQPQYAFQCSAAREEEGEMRENGRYTGLRHK